MKKPLLLSLLLSFNASAGPQLQVISATNPDKEIDLYHSVTGDYVRSIPGKSLPVPVPIERETSWGTYVIKLGGTSYQLETPYVKTNKVYRSKVGCANAINSDTTAATRGLGEGCNYAHQ